MMRVRGREVKQRMLTENLGEEEMKGEYVKEGNEWKLGNRTNGLRLKTHGERRGKMDED